ncbi:glycosyltransferase family 39 protein [Hymenobacter volaticus]|uniref:Glycosyltransferase family 39 protein n=1 Tax=Hymenobacter volaticus TaxID=2932254 RepID=A0ABY4G8F3_9BACT|nr:glycosyltransferase family 39 protein [Hymenobacter volaticus]
MLLAPKNVAVAHTREGALDYLNKYSVNILLALVAIGVFLRVFHLFDNRSFWIDELYLNGNVIKMGFWELVTKPMDYEQKAPLGYLWASKLAVILFGKGEKALRLFSLLCGISALFFFVPVARYFLKSWAAPIAVGILALGEPFVYHSTEAKQYSAELCASVMALYFFVKFHKSLEIKSLLVWGIAGGLLVWFSYSSIFILAGLAIVVSGNLLLNKEWKNFSLKLIPFTIWLFSFSLVYFLFLRKYEDSGWLKNFFEVMYAAYMPMPPSSKKDLVWFAYTHYMMLERNLGMLTKFGDHIKNYSPLQTFFRMPFLPIIMEAVGGLILFRKSKYLFLILTTPIFLTLLASGFKFYPFYERFILFLAPLFLLLIAYGAEQTVNVLNQNISKAIAPILFILLLLPPFWNAVRFTLDPSQLYKKEYNREALLYADDRFKEGDAVYVYWNMNHAYKYYKDAYSLKYDALGRDDLRHVTASKQEYYDKIRQQLGDLRGKKRLWLIQNPDLRNNIGDYPGRTPKWYYDPNFLPARELESVISELGVTPVDSFQRPSIDVKLYELKTGN